MDDIALGILKAGMDGIALGILRAGMDDIALGILRCGHGWHCPGYFEVRAWMALSSIFWHA